LEIKDSQCYNTYAAIKGRKNGSRTYFFDRASEKLNQRMVQDEERERMRKR
ncbi:RteC protein, partial [Bacteroides fragilis]